jgi:hypothetical protein
MSSQAIKYVADLDPAQQESLIRLMRTSISLVLDDDFVESTIQCLVFGGGA